MVNPWWLGENSANFLASAVGTDLFSGGAFTVYVSYIDLYLKSAILC